MSRIQATFAQLASEGRKALIPFVHAGDPYPETTVELMLAMAEENADDPHSTRRGEIGLGVQAGPVPA